MMKRVYRLPVIFALLTLLIVACGGPTEDARQWADRFPAEIQTPAEEDGAEPIIWWEKSEDRTQYAIETQARSGYATISYEGDDDRVEDVVAYITIHTYGNESSAEVALEDAMLNWQLQGARFDTERFGADAFDVATLNGGLLAYYQEDETLFEIRILPEETGAAVDEDAARALYETILTVIENAD